MNFENAFIILFAVTMLQVAISSRLEVYVKMLSAQGFLLFWVAYFQIPHTNYLIFGFVAAETLGLKMLLIPWYLRRMMRENEVFRETEPYLPNLYSLAIVSIFMGIGFVFTWWLTQEKQPVNPVIFGGGISVILSAFFIVLTRKKLITHVMGYIFLENGIFLLSLSLATEMPLVVSLGVALEIFVWVFLAGAFVRIVTNAFPGQQVDHLKILKG